MNALTMNNEHVIPEYLLRHRPSRGQSQKKKSRNSLRQIIYNCRIPVVWLFGISILATIAIASANLIEEKINSEKYFPETSILSTPAELPKTPQQEPTLPMWVYVWIFLGCPVGCVPVTYALSKLTFSSAIVRTRSKPPRRGQTKKPPVKKQNRSKKPTVAARNSVQRSALATISSPQQSIPKERREPTLAELMDLRKQRSLSSLMHNDR